MQACIVIPVYQIMPNEYERIGLFQCAKVFSNYPIALVCPDDFDATEYQRIFNNKLMVFSFPAKYFKGLKGYNQLMTSLKFYKVFKDYSYILIYHTDAYVFRDELEYWCSKGYDYIGAPLYEYNGTISPQKYIGVGNGGFCLHKVNSAIKVLQSWKMVYTISDLNKWYFKYNWKGRIRYFPYYIRSLLGVGRYSHSGFNHLKINEDIFWGIYVPRTFTWFKVAPYDEAYKFSMEYNCKKLYELNNCQLPFGCHQWFKGEFLEFWKEKIKLNN